MTPRLRQLPLPLTPPYKIQTPDKQQAQTRNLQAQSRNREMYTHHFRRHIVCDFYHCSTACLEEQGKEVRDHERDGDCARREKSEVGPEDDDDAREAEIYGSGEEDWGDCYADELPVCSLSY